MAGAPLWHVHKLKLPRVEPISNLYMPIKPCGSTPVFCLYSIPTRRESYSPPQAKDFLQSYVLGASTVSVPSHGVL